MALGRPVRLIAVAAAAALGGCVALVLTAFVAFPDPTWNGLGTWAEERKIELPFRMRLRVAEARLTPDDEANIQDLGAARTMVTIGAEREAQYAAKRGDFRLVAVFAGWGTWLPGVPEQEQTRALAERGCRFTLVLSDAGHPLALEAADRFATAYNAHMLTYPRKGTTPSVKADIPAAFSHFAVPCRSR